MRVLGLVTARGGSKGFPGKNLATIAGRPLVAWSHHALAALRERHPELVLHLSTDSPDIAAAWPEADRPRRLRPAELARDDSSSMAVVDHELAQMASEGRPCDAVLLLQPTSPLATVDDLEAMWMRFAAGAASIIGVAAIAHPVQWSFYRRDDGILDPVLEFREARRQDLKPAFLPVGFYLSRTTFLQEHRAFSVAGLTTSVVVTAASAVDIDHPVDLDLAVALLHRTSGERPFTLGTRTVGDGASCFIIAEIAIRQDANAAQALALVRTAAEAGVDAVTFHTLGDQTLASSTACTGNPDQAANPKRPELPLDTLHACHAEAERLGLAFLATPFDEAGRDQLAPLGASGIKLGSSELSNLPLLAHAARLGRPLIVSTGMATLDEVEAAARAIRRHGDPPVAWLHGVNCCPAPTGEANLRAMDSLRLALGGPVGWSDHTTGNETALAAVARGAQVIEKRLTLDRTTSGPDHTASLGPEDFARLITQIRIVESALGDGIKRPASCERDSAKTESLSLVAAHDLPVGHMLTATDLAVEHPDTGIPPMSLERLVGRRLTKPLRRNALIAWDDLAP